ncbi:hypothetical protein ACHAXM_001621 [Skeletonema potamos]
MSSMKKRTASDAGLPEDSTPCYSTAVSKEDAPCCWVCLEEEEEESGALVRNCSCRGSSGFAHLSCMIKHAESKVMRVQIGDLDAFMSSFQTCPNCNQDYQDDIHSEMTRAMVTFVERDFEGILRHGVLHLASLAERLGVLDVERKEDRSEGEEICSKLLSIIEEMKSDDEIRDNWERRGIIAAEANAYVTMGGFARKIGSEEKLKEAKKYFEKTRDIYSVMDDGDDEMMTSFFDNAISNLDAKIKGEKISHDESTEITLFRSRYEYLLRTNGGGDPTTINAGVDLVDLLRLTKHSLEAERLVQNLVVTSNQVHGPAHQCTRNAFESWTCIRERLVFVKSEQKVFQALRYEDDGETCVVAPLTATDKDLIHVAFSVKSGDLIPGPGTPVVVHGLRLRSKSHLNGKIGDLRAHSGKRRCVVHFEEDLEPTEVMHENVRILFALPEKEE